MATIKEEDRVPQPIGIMPSIEDNDLINKLALEDLRATDVDQEELDEGELERSIWAKEKELKELKQLRKR